MRFPTKIPTILGLFLVIVMVVGVAISFESLSRLPIAASASIEPKNIQMTNISDNGFSIIWTTEAPTTGVLLVSVSTGNQTVLDERDITGKLGKYQTHMVTVRGLKPDTEYKAKILSNGRTYLDNTGNPYVIRTFSTLSSAAGNLNPAYGQVTTSDNQPATGSLVMLSVEGSQTLSALVKPSGAWLIPLNLIRSADGNSYIPSPFGGQDRYMETIIVISDGSQSRAITDTLNDSPVPVIVLGKNYDFRKLQAKQPQTVAEAESTPGSAVLGDQTIQAPQTQKIVGLSSPIEGTFLSTQYPLIQGTGIPGKPVTVTIGFTNPISDTTTVGQDGIFRFTPPSALPPGKQMVTIMSFDALNKPVAITHTFEILKSGSQVLQAATPSATLTPTITPFISPTLILSPTPTSTLSGKQIPPTATITPTIILIIAGSLLLTGGFVAFMIP